MAKTGKNDLATGANIGRQLDRSGGVATRDEYVKNITAQITSGKLNRQLRRVAKALRRGAAKGKKTAP